MRARLTITDFRLTGVYAFIVLFHVSLMRYVPIGPANKIDYYVTSCQEGWWTNLLYVNNFIREKGHV